MMNRFVFALIALFSFAEATLPARALSVPATIPNLLPTDASGAFILVRKGKGHGDGEERFEPHRRYDAHGSSRYRRHSRGMRGFNGNQRFGHYSRFGGSNQNQPDGQN
jgi:hypothetical protein